MRNASDDPQRIARRDHLDPYDLDDGGLGVRSVEVLVAGQDESGGFLASPTFPVYRFAWLRDGSFCARALDMVGRGDRAALFHRWVSRTVLAHREHAERAIADLHAGRTPEPSDILPARYIVDGRREEPGADASEDWPNYQLDGYGTWLYELATHVRLHGDAAATVDRTAVDLVARYLGAAWRTDCYDCWEEFGDGQHAATIAAVAAGLAAAADLLDATVDGTATGRPDDAAPHDAAAFRETAAEIGASFRDRFVRDGVLRKDSRDDRVDGSLLWCALPFGLLDVADPVMRRTAEAIRADLRGGTGGLYRYRGDTYYGGGEWILLVAWLGWYDAATGNVDGWRAAIEWIRAAATAELDLPEQTTDGVQEPDMVEPWTNRWGPVATPLLWSHAMYLIMAATR